MNNRIRELAEQAGIEFDDDFPLEPETIYYLKLSDFEKFAELIVAECIKEVEGLQVSDWNQNWNQAIAHTVLHLKEHFGVKE